MDLAYYLGAKYTILKIKERLMSKLDQRSYTLLETELEKIEKELDLRYYVSEEQKRD
jgi:pyruvate/2-oxoglutarate dehydrogenase complex dihydrolipoamide dehydrogenase (E3) component